MANATQNPSRLTIDFAVEGYPCHLELEVSAADFRQRLDRTIAAIIEAGGVPPVTLTATPATPPSETPTCPYHGPMKESTKVPGSFFCPSKMGDGSYCKEKYPKK